MVYDMKRYINVKLNEILVETYSNNRMSVFKK